MPSGPAAAHTSIFRTAFLGAVMVIAGAGGRSSNGACTDGRSASGFRRGRQRGRPDHADQLGTRT
jgi:hypothetical protein